MARFFLFIACLSLFACGAPETPGNEPEAADAGELERTFDAHEEETPTPTPAATTPPVVEVAGGPVTYGELNGKELQGYLSQPADAGEDLPALIVIHEWWGLNDNVKGMADRLAAEGYRALAVDLYEGKVAADVPDALKLMTNLTENPAPAGENLKAAYAYLSADSSQVGSIGWCLGGRWSLQTALIMPDQIDATVIYYGNVTSDPEKLGPLQMPVLGHFASNDQVVPTESVVEFEAAMKELGKDVDVHIYEGTEHGFSNPSGQAYNAEAAEKAWGRTTAFLGRCPEVSYRAAAHGDGHP